MSQDDGLLAQHLIHQSQSHADRHFWHRLRWRWISNRIKGLLNSGSVLDLGAGAGVAGLFMKSEKNYKYYFAEPITVLRKKLSDDYGSDRDLTDAKKYQGIQVVIMLDVLEHIEDHQGFLSSLREKMDMGANLLILVPARQELWSAWDQKLGHFRRYTTSMLEDVGRQSGFQVIDARYLFPQFFLLGLIRKKFFAPKEGNADLPILPPLLNQLVFCLGAMVSFFWRRPPLGSSAFLHLKKS